MIVGLRETSLARSKSGFSLIEALVSVVFVGLGVVAALNGMSAISAAQSRQLEKEKMMGLAKAKYDEVVATGEYAVSSSGNYEEEEMPEYEWTSENQTTGIEGVSLVTVRVTRVDGLRDREEVVYGLVHEPTPIDVGAQ